MRVVDRDQRLAGLGDLLHAAGHGLELVAGGDGLVQAQAQGAQRGQHAQQIGHVVLSDQTRLQHMAVRVIFDDRELQAV
ncbi:hypothetical protein D3C86_2046670 [compost metagenome]